MPLFPALGKQRQANLCAFEASLVYIQSSRTAWPRERDHVSKQNRKKKKKRSPVLTVYVTKSKSTGRTRHEALRTFPSNKVLNGSYCQELDWTKHCPVKQHCEQCTSMDTVVLPRLPLPGLLNLTLFEPHLEH